jgi:hypothetical protein
VAAVAQVKLGVEEEGVPWTVETMAASSVTELASAAASASTLDVGVGVTTDGTVGLRHDEMAEGALLVVTRDASGREARTVGTNAARLVKRQPLRT